MRKSVRGYIFSRPFFDERAPQHIQNIVIREFCEKNNLNYQLSVSEYAFENSFSILLQVVKELEKVHGIVAYSLFQMPEEKSLRQKVFKKILGKQKVIYFALEDLKISNETEFNDIEEIWSVKSTLVKCPKDLKKWEK